MRIFLYTIILLIAGHTISVSSNTIDAIYKKYEEHSDIYGAKPVNRFSQAGGVTKSSCEGKISSYISNSFLASNMKLYEAKLFDCVTFNEKAIAFIGVNAGVLNSSVDLNKSQPFYYGFAYIDFKNKMIDATEFNVKEVDLEIGSYSRSLWDVIEYEDHKYLLVLLRKYESYNFELYEIKEAELKKVGMHFIGGL